MQAWLKLDDTQVIGALERLLALGQNLEPALSEIAALGENTTRLRFRTETAPDGSRWQKSLRAQLAGGRTLTQDGHLSGSISSTADRSSARWGVNRIYAAVHQFGGVIQAKGKALKFRIPGGGFAVVKAVRIPARPYLGVNEDDRADILDVLEQRIGAALGGLESRFGGGHAG